MQYDLQVIQERVAGIMTGTVNLMRKKIVKNINKAIKDEIKKKKTDPKETEIINNKDKKKKNKVLELVSCIFDGIFGSIGDFIGNMFTNLLNNVLNGALCAIEQFVAGIFAKIFDAIENALSKIMGALSFLSGGLDKIIGLLRNAKGLAKFTKRLSNRDVLSVNGINVYDILRRDQLLITSAALKQLEEKLQ